MNVRYAFRKRLKVNMQSNKLLPPLVNDRREQTGVFSCTVTKQFKTRFPKPFSPHGHGSDGNNMFLEEGNTSVRIVRNLTGISLVYGFTDLMEDSALAIHTLDWVVNHKHPYPWIGEKH